MPKTSPMPKDFHNLRRHIALLALFIICLASSVHGLLFRHCLFSGLRLPPAHGTPHSEDAIIVPYFGPAVAELAKHLDVRETAPCPK